MVPLSLWSFNDTTIPSIKTLKTLVDQFILYFPLKTHKIQLISVFFFVFLSFWRLNNILIMLPVSVIRVWVTKSKLETSSIHHSIHHRVKLRDHNQTINIKRGRGTTPDLWHYIWSFGKATELIFSLGIQLGIIQIIIPLPPCLSHVLLFQTLNQAKPFTVWLSS